MDRLSRLRDLAEQALGELAGPTEFAHERYAAVATLHQMLSELTELIAERQSPSDTRRGSDR